MTIELLASQAAEAYFTALTRSHITNVYSAIEDPDNGDGTLSTERTPPCIIFWGANSQEYPTGSGNWNVMLHARVICAANDKTVSEFLSLYDEAFANLYTDTIAADLSSAITGFHCFGLCGEPQMLGPGDRDGFRINEMILPINCCPSDIAAS